MLQIHAVLGVIVCLMAQVVAEKFKPLASVQRGHVRTLNIRIRRVNLVSLRDRSCGAFVVGCSAVDPGESEVGARIHVASLEWIQKRVLGQHHFPLTKIYFTHRGDGRRFTWREGYGFRSGIKCLVHLVLPQVNARQAGVGEHHVRAAGRNDFFVGCDRRFEFSGAVEIQSVPERRRESLG